ncbi:glycosyltransferase [Ningiella sp. W23]|uniref:glycosyltransferase n=1 Tax=Ningiella sp. W23 TaxID=3023715 RepID=UPI0037572E38
MKNLQSYKQRIIEAVRYDANGIKFVFWPFIWAYLSMAKRGDTKAYADALSSVFRLSWPGTYSLVLKHIKGSFYSANGQLKDEVFETFIGNIDNIERYRQFIDHPENMLDGVITVIAPYTSESKGVLVIAYSYYFQIFLKLFDHESVAARYHIVLEPSWNGLSDPSILSFSKLTCPVFVMAYEDRDYQLLQDLNSNIVPVKLSANWFIDPQKFNHALPFEKRDIDIIMIAAWAKFKRHDRFFEALSSLKSEGMDLKVTLVGYPNDMTMDDIKQLAREKGVDDLLTFHEWIPSEKVSELVGRAKVNIIWSRFEGLNRAIIEGMFCDTPCIIREGFNFGMRYPYINEQTGLYSGEKALPNTIRHVMSHHAEFSPRAYVEKSHNCFVATQILAEAIKAADPHFETANLVDKTSELDGMIYVDESNNEKMKGDYKYLQSMIN